MYAEIDQQQLTYAEIGAAANRVLAAAQPDLDRHQALTVRRAPDAPLTALERLALSSACSALADALTAAADIWARYDRSAHRPLSRAYRAAARRFHDASALHDALAVIAPADQGPEW